MTAPGSQASAPSLLRCLRNHRDAEQHLDYLATRTTGATQQQAQATVDAILRQVQDQGDEALIALEEQMVSMDDRVFHCEKHRKFLQ